MIFDDVGNHLGEAGSYDRAAVPLGMYLAWCANHQLLSDAVSRHAADLIMRVRVREVTGSEFAVAGLGGRLDAASLNPEGLAFTQHYYPGYLADFRDEFGHDPYAVRDDWTNYDRIARRLTRALMGYRGVVPAGGAGRHGRRRRWWPFR